MEAFKHQWAQLPPPLRAAIEAWDLHPTAYHAPMIAANLEDQDLRDTLTKDAKAREPHEKATQYDQILCTLARAATRVTNNTKVEQSYIQDPKRREPETPEPVGAPPKEWRTLTRTRLLE